MPNGQDWNVSHSGRTPLQQKQITPGTPEHAEISKVKLRSDMLPLKKKLIQLKMGVVERRFNEGKEAVHKSVELIPTMDALKRALRSEGYTALLGEGY